jgi:hypothetical protein
MPGISVLERPKPNLSDAMRARADIPVNYYVPCDFKSFT